MKNWILKTFFQKELDHVFAKAVREGSMDAFKKAHEDIMETMRDDLDTEAEKLASQKVSALLGVVDEDYIITYNEKQGFIFLAGERVPPERLHNLKQEAELILSTDMWHVFYSSLGDIARKMIFDKSETYDDVVRGKMLLYQLSIQKKILDMLKNYTPKT